ncbi:MAG: pyridoxamine 5'-phosphate oxidase family protein [Bacteroidota bacterium]
MSEIDRKIKVIRAPKRGHYDKETIYRILDQDFLCHVGFVHEGSPVVIPTLYGRDSNSLYIHGSMASRMMKNLEKGCEVCITITQVDGLVLARSAFHHSMNYQSVVVFGIAELVTGKEKMTALEVISDQIIADRWEEVRKPNEKEMKATMVLKISLDQASAKIRTGGPVDEEADHSLDVWAGHVPVKRQYLAPMTDKLIDDGRKVSPSVQKLLREK